MNIFRNIIILISFTISTVAFSQEKEAIKLNIQVVDQANNPIAGAIILFDDVKQERTTNENGNFKIILKKSPKSISAFSPNIGIKKIVYDNSSDIKIIITPENNIYSIKNEDINYKNDDPIQYRNIYDYLRGKVSGLNIDSNYRITIRGYGTVNGSTTPLFILNDNPVDQTIFSNIEPTTIKHVKVLKGPETAAYGSRGGNGVIIVQTL